MENALVIATGITALSTLVLAIATAFLAKKTSETSEANRQMVEANRDMVNVNNAMLDENRRMVEINSATLEEIKTGREAQERPFVAVELDYEQYPMLYVLIRNFGRGPAINVGFNFSPELETPEEAMAHGRNGSLGLSSMELPLFTRGIRFMPPRARISLWWGATDLVIKDFYKRNLQGDGIRVEIFYESIDGQHYEEETYLDPTVMGSALYFQPPSLNKLVDPVVKAAEKLDKAIEHQGYLKIKTATERRFENKAAQRDIRQQADMNRREIEKQQEEALRRREQDESQS